VVLLRPATKGGAFEALAGDGRRARELEKRLPGPLLGSVGDAVVFPAQKLWHRVTAVEEGQRSSLVFWVSTRPAAAATTEATTAGTAPAKDGDESEGEDNDDDDDDEEDEEGGIGLPEGSGNEHDDDEEWRVLEQNFLAGDVNLSDDFEEDSD
jgi:hypothetical protein